MDFVQIVPKRRVRYADGSYEKARENKVKFEIAEYNKQEDSDLQDKAPLIIANCENVLVI